MRHFSTFQYNPDSTIAWEKTPLGNQTNFYYGVDQNGNANAQAVTISEPDGVKTTHYYDSYGHLVTVQDALSYTVRYSNFDFNNNAQTVQDERSFYWNYTFDSLGNILTTKSPTGDLTTLHYNGHNKPTWIQAPNKEQVALSYDAQDNLYQVDNKDSGGTIKATTKFTVSASTYGLVTDKYDANNHHTHYDYADGYGNLTAVTTPQGHKSLWVYNADGAAISRTDPLGITATYTLDTWNRTTAVSYSNVLYGGQDGNKTYGYAPNSNLTSFANTASSYTRSYDNDNRMLEEDRSGVLQVKHIYDGNSSELGLLSQTMDADGNTVYYGYTQRNELAWVSEFGQATNYSYYADSSEQTINDPIGNYATKTWDNDERLQTLVNKTHTGGYLSGYSYTYDADNQKKTCAETGYNGASYANVTWGYDPLGHLNSESRTGGSARTATYTVDGVGNRQSQTINGVTTTFSYDTDDELKSDNRSSTYSYDANGNMTGRSRNGVAYPYYTNENQISVIYTGNSLPAYNYSYDALGRQVSRADASGNRTDYQYDGDAVLTEKQGGSTTSRYLLDTSRLAKYGEAPQLDGLGNMRQGLGQSSGTFTGRADYPMPGTFGWADALLTL